MRRALDDAATKGYGYDVDGRFKRSGEFEPEALLVSRIRSYASVRWKGSLLFKWQEGLWKRYGEVLGEKVENPDPEVEDIMDTLLSARAPHEMVQELLDISKRGRKDDVVRINGQPCDEFVFSLDPDRVKGYLETRIERAVKDKRISKPDEIRWRHQRGTLTFYLSRKDGGLVRMSDDRSVKLVYKGSGAEDLKTYSTEIHYDFRDIGNAPPQVPDPVRDKLGMPKK